MSSSFFDPNDPGFAALIDMFVDSLSERIESIEGALTTGDLSTLRRIGHQLKGASASYGFEQLTAPALALQILCEGETQNLAVTTAAQTLATACQTVIDQHAPTAAVCS